MNRIITVECEGEIEEITKLYKAIENLCDEFSIVEEVDIE